MMIFVFILLCIIGLAVFLYGIKIFSKTLKEYGENNIKKYLSKAVSNKYKGVLIGASFTAIVQSSSAVTVMLVSVAQASLLTVNETVGIIMGANIGTTITAWFVSFCNLDFNLPIPAIVIISLILFFVYLILTFINKSKLSSIFLGLAMLLLGIFLMSNSMYIFKDFFISIKIFEYCKNPLVGMFVGVVLTAILQSSSVSVGVLQAMSATGAITFSVAIPFIAGVNIGSCVTALIATIGGNKNARATGLIHFYFNLIGSFVLLSAFYGVNIFMDYKFLNEYVNMLELTIVHTLFNVLTTIILLPFSNVLVKLSKRSVY